MCSLDDAIARARLVSFDVFDTLVRRPFLEPTHLFDALGQENRIPDFGSRRRAAEQAARVRLCHQRDITIRDIYDLLDQEPNLELEMERRALYSREDIATWLRTAKAAGKRTVAISDVYLPREFVAHILDELDLIVDDLIVSSSDDVAKFDGSAFRLVCQRHNVAFQDTLHLGDNEQSDYFAPTKLGIKAALVGNRFPRGSQTSAVAGLIAKLQENGSYRSSIVGSVIRDLVFTGGASNFWEDLGRYYVAPLAFGFSQWVLDQVSRKGLANVAFVARDGKLPHAAFRRLTSDVRSSYVHLSRAVVMQAALDSQSEPFLRQLTGGVSAPVSDYISRIGLGSETLLPAAKEFFRGDPVVGRDINRDDLLSFFSSQRETMAEIAGEARVLLRRYLDAHGLLDDPNKVALVDVGWSGTVASLLQELFPEARRWTYLYFGTLSHFEPKNAKHRGMFFQFGEPARNQQLVFECVEIVETLFSSPDSSAIRLQDRSGEVVPVFADDTSEGTDWRARAELIAEGCNGALPFFERASNRTGDFRLDDATTYGILEHLLRSHDDECVRELGSIYHRLGFGASKSEQLLRSDPSKYWSTIWKLLKGREIKSSSGTVYWPYQQERHFVAQQRGIKATVARRAMKVKRRGGLRFVRKRRKKG